MTIKVLIMAKHCVSYRQAFEMTEDELAEISGMDDRDALRLITEKLNISDIDDADDTIQSAEVGKCDKGGKNFTGGILSFG